MQRVDLFANEKFRKILNEHPDLPIVFLANEDANTGDYSLVYCESVHVSIGEILNEETPYDKDTTFTDRDEFEEAIADAICDEEECREMNDVQFDATVKKIAAQYDKYWADVIEVVVGN